MKKCVLASAPQTPSFTRDENTYSALWPALAQKKRPLEQAEVPIARSEKKHTRAHAPLHAPGSSAPSAQSQKSSLKRATGRRSEPASHRKAGAARSASAVVWGVPRNPATPGAADAAAATPAAASSNTTRNIRQKKTLSRTIHNSQFF